MAHSIDFFDVYNHFGWEIIPVRRNSKTPFYRHWNEEYDARKVRSLIMKNPDCNLGLRLGKIVDVEGDTQKANDWLRQHLTVPHPIFMSEKSTHHLFLAPSIKFNRVVVGGIEFRGRKHQSLLPPSVNTQGIKYAWLDTNLRITPMPPVLCNLLRSARKGDRPDRVTHVCTLCYAPIQINRNRHALEVQAFGRLGLTWRCRGCRTVDIRKICREIRQGH